MEPGSIWDPSLQTHIGPFDPDVQMKSQWTWLQLFDAKISNLLYFSNELNPYHFSDKSIKY